jgi:flagellar biosynthesis protein FlhB
LHVAQTRALAIPRRRVDGAPRPARGVDRRAADAGIRMIRAALVAGTAIGWTWIHLADLGHLAELPTGTALAGAGVLALGMIAHLAAALLVAGALDLGVAVLRHRADLRMTRREQIDDARAAGLDPRWRADRRGIDTRDAAAAVATARVVITGDGAAAVRYHARLWPRPMVVAVGRGMDATRLIEGARRHRITIHHDPALARALGDAGADAAVPDRWLEPLAEIIAADDESGVAHSRA